MNHDIHFMIGIIIFIFLLFLSQIFGEFIDYYIKKDEKKHHPDYCRKGLYNTLACHECHSLYFEKYNLEQKIYELYMSINLKTGEIKYKYDCGHIKYQTARDFKIIR